MDDLRTEWPWSLEEEIQWKARLEQQEADLEDMIDLEAEPTESPDIVRPQQQEVAADDVRVEKYLVTA
jgi:hypothetical protein